MAVGFSVLQNQARAKGGVDPVSQGIRTTIGPMVGLASRGAQGVGDIWVGLQTGPKLRVENEALRNEVNSLRIYQAEAADALAQLRAIQDLNTMPLAPGIQTLYGRVVGYWPNEHRLTLNVGSKDGVEPNRAVVSAEGLAGVVDTVSPDSCQVLLITSAATRIGGKVVKTVTSYGLVRGLTKDSLGMEVPSNAPVETGDMVVSSGISEWIRGGIPIGEVTQITDRKEFGTKQLVVFPAFRLSAGRYMAVLK